MEAQRYKTPSVQDSEQHAMSSVTLAEEVPTEISTSGLRFCKNSTAEEQIDSISQHDRVRELACFRKSQESTRIPGPRLRLAQSSRTHVKPANLISYKQLGQLTREFRLKVTTQCGHTFLLAYVTTCREGLMRKWVGHRFPISPAPSACQQSSLKLPSSTSKASIRLFGQLQAQVLRLFLCTKQSWL